MDTKNKGVIGVIISSAKTILVFLSGGILFHLVVMVIDYYLIVKPFSFDIRENFSGSIFSEPMWPMMAVYGILSLGLYLLWNKAKNAVLAVREKELQKEKAEAVVKSMQRLTGIMAEHIASQNSDIMSWIEDRKRLGHPVPTKVKNPSQQIAKAIHSMSELTFIVPYTDNRPNNIYELEKILFDKLSNLTDVTSRPPKL